MSNLTKLEEVASRMMAGMMASPTWEESTYKESSEGARLAAQALLAECAKHEPTPEPIKYGPSYYVPKFPNPLHAAVTEDSSVTVSKMERVQTDDAWLVRVPTDPIPETWSVVRFADGKEVLALPGELNPWSDESWRHQWPNSDNTNITHYKP